MMAASNRAQIEAYIGASGSGKGVSIRRRLDTLGPARLVIWDARSEYVHHAKPVTLPGLVAALRPGGPASFRVRYVPDGRAKVSDAFDLVCRAAFAAGDLVLLAEELSDVTTASWAPPAWRQCVTQGRHRALHLLGATQRPALIDKTFLGNATRIRCGAIGYEADRRVMATELDCSRDLVAGLRAAEVAGGGALLTMIERDRTADSFELIEVSVSGAGRVSEKRRPASR